MISLEEACGIYAEHFDYPIDSIEETEDMWVFAPRYPEVMYTGSGTPAVRKDGTFEYASIPDLPPGKRVEVPEEYRW